MPDFEGIAPKARQSKLTVPTHSTGVPMYIEPRCHVCMSPHRNLVDQMLAAGVSFSEIARSFEHMPANKINRKSIASHKLNHLGYEEAAIRAVIEREAAIAQRNHEEGVERLITKQTYLEVALQKAYDQLINNMVEIPAGDAVKLIETLQKLQSQGHEVAIDELRVQFNAFMQAVRENVATDVWEAVRKRTHEIVRSQGRDQVWDATSPPISQPIPEPPPVQIEAPIEAEVVDDVPPTDE